MAELKRDLVGMYVHQHWPYRHPYAARTWSENDWLGYASGLHALGYNAVMIWPVLETMPSPLLVSDRASLEKLRRVVERLHTELDMAVYLALCPNVVPVDAVARRAPFEERHFFYCDARVDPSDAPAVDHMLRRRAELLAPLAQVDGVVIIDSDPGGYPGSTNAEFAALLAAHRALLDRLRPGIELVYWMHAGWEAYCRYYATGEFRWGTDAEFTDLLERLAALELEPWGLANGLEHAARLGLESRVISYRYGAIEGEPTFPTTNFSGERAHEAGARRAPRGVMGNAQTHCLQLPNTLAFVRGAQGRAVSEADYLELAERLVPGCGQAVVAGWRAMASADGAGAGAAAGRLEKAASSGARAGELAGLLFGDPGRFLADLAMQLRLRAACLAFTARVEWRGDYRPALRAFVKAASAWQARHGYQNRWHWPRLREALRRLGVAELDRVLAPPDTGVTPFEQVQARYFRTETETVRLLQALRRLEVIGYE